MHPLLVLLATRPQLLVDHAQAYAALCQEDFGLARSAWLKQLVWQAVAWCGLITAVVLGGVAVMLWAVTPQMPIHAVWALWVTPLLPLAIAVLGFVLASQQNQTQAFSSLSRQINADLAMLRALDLP